VYSPHDYQTAFYFSGPETTKELKNSGIINVTITDNELLASSGWTGVFASKGVEVTVDDCVFANNRNMETGVTASEASSVTVSGTLFIGNFGTNGDTPNFSALALAAGDASLVIEGTYFRDNSNYDAQVFCIFRSLLVMDSSCIIGGSSEQVIFVSQDSDFSGSNEFTNFISNHSSTSCNSHGNSLLFKEDKGSTCFQGGAIRN
jgi:hypothetical protein